MREERRVNLKIDLQGSQNPEGLNLRKVRGMIGDAD
jgi:hypothetical protein